MKYINIILWFTLYEGILVQYARYALARVCSSIYPSIGVRLPMKIKKKINNKISFDIAIKFLHAYIVIQ